MARPRSTRSSEPDVKPLLSRLRAAGRRVVRAGAAFESAERERRAVAREARAAGLTLEDIAVAGGYRDRQDVFRDIKEKK